jgi:OHCU decarboxylase
MRNRAAMRSDPADYELVAPGSLEEVVAMLAREPGVWLPIAGGTDVMVLYGAGTLCARKLVSIWNLRELRAIEESRDEIAIGAASTYTDLRQHAGIVEEFSLLTRAASWTGGIANQNRGTLGGNIANASPAADCLPALLVYDAELTLISLRGERRVAYRGFHAGYKKTAMAADELIRTIHLKKKFAGYFAFTRKVGARQSQAIAKVNIAALGKLANGAIEDVHIALGSVAPVPLRLDRLERALMGKKVESFSVDELRRQLAEEIATIDDIRSTARYRAAVAGNLIIEFLQRLGSADRGAVKESLVRWNRMGHEEATQSILPCCGARAWANAMAARRPFENASSLLEISRGIWWKLEPADWLEAFGSHPRIGESQSPGRVSGKSQKWSAEEQGQVVEGDQAVKLALEQGNRQYEEQFGRIFIVCATGKSPSAILEILRRRLRNDQATELQESAKEQEQITEIRLKKWLGE